MFGRKPKKPVVQTPELSKDLGRTFLKGIVYGLGMITAFAVVVPAIVWILRTIDWIPFFSDIALQIAERIRDANN